ncbi:MAG TPA: 3-deoxy-manno-octulosonate cytidylyltransferase [Steroidobacteraceae bacterium]|jgi:3-deoxy-manno-octulosonate cytidylyltransferase (CMP-KDO synthetase)|nr:3-deoxy-manno-octulosonate cytidylyltransferase [Steroidobacteraceae bacterium]
MYRVVIPARYGSSRLPGKPLLLLLGKPMLEWVYRRARRSQAHEVIIATDDERIMQAAHGFGAAALLTAATHSCGTERIAEVARRLGWDQADIVVNVQGDEPLMPPALIDQVAAALAGESAADIATLATPIESLEQLLDPNVVKVVTDARQRALYFSRAPIPWARDSAPAGLVSQSSHALARRHLGIYAYRVAALARAAALPPSPLELIERLEQLRALENGMTIRVADALQLPGADVNTPADVAAVEALLASDQYRL